MIRAAAHIEGWVSAVRRVVRRVVAAPDWLAA